MRFCIVPPVFRPQRAVCPESGPRLILRTSAHSLIPPRIQTGKETLKTLSVSVRGVTRLPPHPQQAGGNISGRARLVSWSVRFLHPFTPAPALKPVHNRIWNEPAAASVDMPVSRLALLMCVKPLRHDEVQFVLGPHGHIQEPPFFFDL